MNLRIKIIIPVLLALSGAIILSTVLNIFSMRTSLYNIIDESIDAELDTLHSQLEYAENIEMLVRDMFSEKNLALARAVSELIAKDENVLSLNELRRIANLFKVDEIHVVDADGILTNGTHPDLYQYDFASADQTIAFLAILDDASLELAQRLQARGIDDVPFQYNGVARKDAPGIVQVGINADTVYQISELLKVQSLVEKMRVGKTGFASIIKDGVITHHRDHSLIGKNVSDENWYSAVNTGSGKKWVDFEDGGYYVGYMQKGDQTLLLQFPKAEYNSYVYAIINQGIIFLALSIIFMAALLYFIIYMVFKPLRDLSQKLNQIAQGNLDVAIASNEPDEIGLISQDIAKVVDVFHYLLRDINAIVKANDEDGDFEHRIDSAKYEGGFKEVAQGINNMIEYQVKDTRDLLNLLDNFGSGDFTVNLPSYPGKKAAINMRVNKMSAAIGDIIKEIAQSVHQAKEGNLSYRADSSKYKGDWAAVMAEVNALIDAFSMPLNEVSQGLACMSQGDLSVKIHTEYKGDYAIIKNSFNTTLDFLASYIMEISSVLKAMSNDNFNLTITRDYVGDFVEIKNSLEIIIRTFNDMLMEINHSADQIATGSLIVSDTSTELSQSAVEEKNNVVALNNKISEIDQSIAINAENAEKVNHLVTYTKENAEQNNGDMQTILVSMKDIDDASRNISQIINVIEDIAFQTNLLALNATVEAARAGEYGKGFSVVAGEVKSLATRSQQAAKQTTELIETSIMKTANGSKIVQESAAAMAAMAQNITTIATHMDNISGTSQKQKEALAQIMIALSGIDKISQQNATTAMQLASASEELSSTSHVFKDTVSRFNLNTK